MCFLNANFLYYPPYWDSIIGSFHQAIWLKENNFDFYKLWFEMPTYVMGGPKIYCLSVYPVFQAILMICVQNVEVQILINHLIQLMLATGCLFLMFEILKREVSTAHAILGCIAFASFPLTIAQAYLLNMEYGVLFFSLLSTHLFLIKKIKSSFISIIIAASIKQSALVLCPIFALLCFLDKKKNADCNTQLKGNFFSLLFLSLTGLMFLESYLIKASPLNTIELKFDPFSVFTSEIFIRLAKYIYFSTDAFLIVTIYIFAYLFYLYSCIPRDSTFSFYIRKAGEHVTTHESSSICFFATCLFFYSQLALNINLPRYSLILLPFCLMGTIHLIHVTHDNFLVVILLSLIFFNILNLYGAMYKKIFPFLPSHLNGHILERTLEYSQDLQNNIALASFLEKHHQSSIIVTTWPYTHLLSHPNFGYVKTGLKVFSFYKHELLALGVSNSDTLKNDMKLRTNSILIVKGKNIFSHFDSVPCETLVTSFRTKDKVIEVCESDISKL